MVWSHTVLTAVSCRSGLEASRESVYLCSTLKNFEEPTRPQRTISPSLRSVIPPAVPLVLYEMKHRFWWSERDIVERPLLYFLQLPTCTGPNIKWDLVDLQQQSVWRCNPGWPGTKFTEISLPLLCYLPQQLNVKSCASTASLHLSMQTSFPGGPRHRGHWKGNCPHPSSPCPNYQLGSKEAFLIFIFSTAQVAEIPC